MKVAHEMNSVPVRSTGKADQVIEAQLAHAVRDALGTAYNRTEWLGEHRTMMQRWANYQDQLRQGAPVVELRAVAA